MRILCSFVGGAGHLVPQLPLLRALVESGHVLTLSGRASAVSSAPPGLFSRIEAVPDRRTRPAGQIAPLAPVDREAEVDVVARYFAGDAARRSAHAAAPLLGGIDLVVCDELDFGAMAAAQRAGIPVIVVAVIASGALVRGDRIGDALERLADELDVGEAIRWMGDALVVPFARGMRDPAFPAPADALWMRPADGATPEPDGSIVATLGTEFNTESGDLLERMLAALAQIDRRSTLAIGRDLDPARFAPRQASVHVTPYADFSSLLPRASVALHHGGSGMLVAAALAGVPQVLLPMGADQPFNADRATALGIGVGLDVHTARAADIRDAVAAAADDGAMRASAASLAADLLALPAPAEVAAAALARVC